MKNVQYIIDVVGALLIVALGYLLKDHFESTSVLVLDVIVLIMAYVTGIYVLTGFVQSTSEFLKSVPGLGVNIYFFQFYSILVVLGVLFGYFVDVAFKWQLFYQIGFGAFLVLGLLTGRTAVERQNQVASNSQKRQESKEQLFATAQLLKSAALSKLTDEELKNGFTKFAERVNYMSPSDSAAARALEGELALSMSVLRDMVKEDGDSEQIAKELENANRILKQRIQTY